MKDFAFLLENELVNDILPFWTLRMTDVDGGFYGRMDGKGILRPEAEKGAILNARILWTFAAAYRITGAEACRDTASRAFEYIRNHFLDNDI